MNVPLTRVVPALLLALVACGGDGGDSSKSKTGTTGTTDTGESEETIEAVFPTESMDRVLLYYGNGGYEPGSSKGAFDDFDNLIKTNLGWNTDHRNELPADLTGYRMIGFIALGHDGGDNFTATEIAAIQAALAVGTRVAFFADRESCASTVMADAMTQLGVTMSFTGSAADANLRVDATDLSTYQVTDGLSRVIFKEPCWVNSSGGTRIVNHLENVVAAAQRPATGGDVLLIGDFQALDDSEYLTDESADNATFAELLVKVDPAL
jgi:hypothetical protein